MEPEWQPWTLGRFHPDQCGGHSFMYHPVQLGDLKRQAERSHRTTHGKFQVLHHHGTGQQCNDQCEVYGVEVPKLG